MKTHKKLPKDQAISNFIINKRKSIEVIFAIAFILSIFFYLFVGINYNLTKYLPSTTMSQKGITIMKHEFGYPGTARVMIDNVSLYEAKLYKDKIEATEGVDMVSWADAATDIYQANNFIKYKDIEDYYKNGYSVMDITFKGNDTNSKTSKAIDKIQAITGSKGHFIGAAVQNKSLSENLKKEMASAVVICVGVILMILLLTTTSWVEPILFLLVMGVAIVINSGTNIFLGEVSFMTSSVGSVLQLAVAMDYSIFLMHSFAKERENGLELTHAVASAIRHSAKSILACGVATFFGFIALALMKFSIGFDLGIVLAKGIVISVLTVMLLMPALIIRWSNLITKTTHRSFLPSFDKVARFTFRIRYIVLIITLIVAVPAYIGKGMTNFVYGSAAVGAGKGTKVYDDEQKINAQFGRSNMLLVLIPNTSTVKEKELSDVLENLSYTKSVASLSNTLPQGVPESVIPNNIVSKLHTKKYARILVYIKSKDESRMAFKWSDEIQSIMKKYYPKDSYLIGTTPFTQDIKNTITNDYEFVDKLSLLSVLIVVMLTFRSILIPVLIMIPIEIAIFINMFFPYLMGEDLIFMGYIIVSCIQLGATVDYAILMTNNYLESRSHMDRKAATIEAISFTTPPLLISATILSSVGYILYFTSSISAIGDMGHLIARGTIFSFFLVVSLLPTLLYVFDKPIYNHIKRIQRLKVKVAIKHLNSKNRMMEKIKNAKLKASTNNFNLKNKIVEKIKG